METFGRYLLLRRLAEGGMGELFLAQQAGIAGFAKQLVVKRIKPALAGDRAFVEMFLHEARVAALIDHPNVVQIHELGCCEDRYFIAMEYVPGRSLSSVLEELQGPLELPLSVHILLNLCEGLAYAHAASGLDGQPLGLVHRDISPPNVLLGYSGSVKLSDFGIAKVQHNQQTAAGVLKGKFAYLSPEQARGEEVDARSDIYALGLILFEMSVGRRANPGSSDTGMVFAAARGEVVEPREVRPDYPEPLLQIFRKATALDPSARYPEVRALQEDLLAFQLEQRMVMTASRLGEWLRGLPGSRAASEEPVQTPHGSDAATMGTAPQGAAGPPTPPGLAAGPPGPAASDSPPAFAPTVQFRNPGAVELDLAGEKPSWRSEASRTSVGPLGAGKGLVLMVVVTGLALVVAALIFIASSRRDAGAGSPDGGSPDLAQARQPLQQADAGLPRALEAGVAQAPQADRGVAAARLTPDAAPPAQPVVSPLPRAADRGLPPADRRAAPVATGSTDAQRVYWTEAGPVLP